jgi:hypothetical protein
MWIDYKYSGRERVEPRQKKPKVIKKRRTKRKLHTFAHSSNHFFNPFTIDPHLEE